MRAHEAGALHAEGYGGPPHWLPWPTDVMELLPQLWPQTVRRDEQRASRGRRRRRGDAGRASTAPRHTSSTRRTSAARARAFRDEFAAPFEPVCGGVDVYYAGKAFLCTAVAGWVAEEGLSLDVCLRRRARGRAAGRLPRGADRHARQQQDRSPRSSRRSTYGVGRIIVDSFEEIERIAAVATELGVTAPVMVRVTVGVEAHTHEFIATAHEDQKFGFSLAGGQAAAAIEPRAGARRRAGPARPALPHRQPDLRHLRLRGLRAPAHRAARPRRRPARRAHARDGPRRRLRHRLHVRAHAADPGRARRAAGRPGAPGVQGHRRTATGRTVPRISIEPGRAIVGPSTFTLYEVGTVKDVDLGHGAKRTYVSVDGGMSDNVRTALYDADYSCTLASRRSEAGAAAVPRRRQALRERRHHRHGRVPARRHRLRAT